MDYSRFTHAALGSALAMLATLAVPASARADTCPDGGHLTGAQPPDGYEHGCQIENKDGTKSKHGLWTEWYTNGQKQKEGTYLRGHRHGIWTWWYPNGKKMQEGKFWDDSPTGTWHYWKENGQVEEREESVVANGASKDGRKPETPPPDRPDLDDFKRNLNRGFKRK